MGNVEMKKENCLAYSLMKDHQSDLYGYAPAYEGVGTEELVYAFDEIKRTEEQQNEGHQDHLRTARRYIPR